MGEQYVGERVTQCELLLFYVAIDILVIREIIPNVISKIRLKLGIKEGLHPFKVIDLNIMTALFLVLYFKQRI